MVISTPRKLKRNMSERKKLFDERLVIVEELNQMLNELRVIRGKQKEAKTTQYKTGIYEDISVWDEWSREAASLEGSIRDTQAKLSDIKATLSESTRGWEMHFIDICRESLEAEDFTDIMEESRERASSGVK
jgi:hypothetical protein